MSTNAIYCDGHCVVKENAIGYARITDGKRNSLMNFVDEKRFFTNHGFANPKCTKIETPLGNVDCISVQCVDTPQQQINYAEITALYIGLRVAYENNIPSVYTDSVTANAWSEGRVKAPMTDKDKIKMCEMATAYRRAFLQKGGKVYITEGKTNPADFGHHNKGKPEIKEIDISQSFSQTFQTSQISQPSQISQNFSQTFQPLQNTQSSQITQPSQNTQFFQPPEITPSISNNFISLKKWIEMCTEVWSDEKKENNTFENLIFNLQQLHAKKSSSTLK
jgi:hypothetical protein